MYFSSSAIFRFNVKVYFEGFVRDTWSKNLKSKNDPQLNFVKTFKIIFLKVAMT